MVLLLIFLSLVRILLVQLMGIERAAFSYLVVIPRAVAPGDLTGTRYPGAQEKEDVNTPGNPLCPRPVRSRSVRSHTRQNYQSW